jgi:L,D-peptidoglycan transpeptidase YkuD (ErfK/YbiS/YcfS/YnhG family)
MVFSRKMSERRRRRSVRTSFTPCFLFCAALLLSTPAIAQSCPEALQGALRLILVTGKDMTATAGTAHLFERATPQDAWQPAGPAEPVQLGHAGIAWGLGFHHLAAADEPKKVEGDGRTPTGIYRIGVSFGFAASPRPGHIRIVKDTVCVDDPASPAYNTITSRSIVGRKVRGEDMYSLRDRYRDGLVVDYPTDAKARGGSCIFVHVRRSATSPTGGCVAVPQPRILAWQDFSAPGAVLAVAPHDALGRFAGCLPPVE